MQVDLSGRVAVVAGTDTPVGAVIAAACEANGATVEQLTVAEVANSASAASALSAVVQRNGALDMLVDASRAMTAEGLIQVAGGLMADRGGGRIVALLSATGLLPARREPRLSASHAALAAMIRVQAMELAPRGVLVNGVAVGAVGPDQPHLVSHVPLGRAATPEEVAAAVLFLLDPENTYTVGHILNVDGGWQAGFARDF